MDAIRFACHSQQSKGSDCEAPAPQDITELRAFLGLLNYYSKFLHNFHIGYTHRKGRNGNGQLHVPQRSMKLNKP